MSAISVIKNAFSSTPQRGTVQISEEGEITRTGSTAERRRMLRSDADRFALNSAIYAATRRRSHSVTEAEVILKRKRSLRSTAKDDAIIGRVGDMGRHPVLDLLTYVNQELTFIEAFALLEEHKCVAGEAFWVKRRVRGQGTINEFEILDPRFCEPIKEKDKKGAIKEFKYWDFETGRQRVFPRSEVIYFRHIIDPRNNIRGLSPISAVRVTVDTDSEAKRYNQKFFDQGGQINEIFTGEGLGPAEVDRIEKNIKRKYYGVDNAHNPMVLEGNLKPLNKTITQKDMQFMEYERWTVEDVARAFEMSPVLLGDLSNGADVRTEQSIREFWGNIENQVKFTITELNKYLVWPDFGENLYLDADFSSVPFLERNRKLQSETDEIDLRSGKAILMNYVLEINKSLFLGEINQFFLKVWFNLILKILL